jgi:hypothetical protein
LPLGMWRSTVIFMQSIHVLPWCKALRKGIPAINNKICNQGQETKARVRGEGAQRRSSPAPVVNVDASLAR